MIQVGRSVSLLDGKPKRQAVEPEISETRNDYADRFCAATFSDSRDGATRGAEVVSQNDYENEAAALGISFFIGVVFLALGALSWKFLVIGCGIWFLVGCVFIGTCIERSDGR